MRKLRWAMDAGFWDLDVSTPRTLEGQARAVPRDPLPLGVSRGAGLSRHKQVDFFQRFMFAPFVPQSSSSSNGVSLHRVLTLPLTHDWFVALLGQFNAQKFISSLNKSGDAKSKSFENIRRKLRDKSLYVLGFCSEMLLTPDTTLLLSLDAYGDSDATRKKAVLHQKFANHDLTVEAVSPGLFVDKTGNYWDVPLSLAADVASLPSDLGTSYHICLHHNVGWPELFGGDKKNAIPATLLPGTSIKSAFSLEKTIEIWRSKAQKLKMVQPYDAFLSNPHISTAGIIGAALTACFGDNSVRSQVQDESHDFTGLSLSAPSVKSALLADIFATASCTAQYGNFQKMFLDLTRSHVRLDFPSGAKFLLGAKQVVQDLINSQQPTLEALQTMCPDVTISLQQQIAGPFSFRVDSGVKIDLRNKDLPLRVHDPVFAVEYALQVLGSAKAVAWYSLKQREFMVELRFFET